MTFLKFVFTSVKRNMQIYIAYMFSCAFSVIVFFAFSMLALHPVNRVSYMNDRYSTINYSLVLSTSIFIYMFSIFFVLYSLNMFLKVRKGELATLTILGITPRQLNMLIFSENLIVGSVAIIIGISFGLLFTNFLIISVKHFFNMGGIYYYFPKEALILTIVSYLILFSVISLIVIIVFNYKNTYLLLNSSNKHEKEPKTYIVLGVAGIAFIIYGYYLCFVQQANFNENIFFRIIILEFVGTYLVFRHFTPMVLRVMTKIKRFYLKHVNNIWISELNYKVKSNYRMLFITTMLTTVSFIAIAIFYVNYNKIEESINNDYKYDMFINDYKTDEEMKVGKKIIENSLKEENINYTLLSAKILQIERESFNINFISYDTYENLRKISNGTLVKINVPKDNETILIPEKKEVDNVEKAAIGKEHEIINGKKLYVSRAVNQNVFNSSEKINNFIVNSKTYNELKKYGSEEVYYIYQVDNWKNLSEVNEKINKLIEQERKKIEVKNEYERSKYLSGIGSKYKLYNDAKSNSSLMLTMSFFLGGIFILAGMSFIYFRFHTDFLNDRSKFIMLSKIGLTNKEIRKIATSQMAVLFFSPYILSITHTFFALTFYSAYNSDSIILESIKPISIFILLEVIYFIVIRDKYVKNLEEYL